MSKDPYKILGVPRTATSDQIEAAWRVLALKYHPDNKQTGDPEKFMEVQTAVSILRNPEKRQTFDAGQLRFEDFQPVLEDALSSFEEFLNAPGWKGKLFQGLKGGIRVWEGIDTVQRRRRR